MTGRQQADARRRREGMDGDDTRREPTRDGECRSGDQRHQYGHRAACYHTPPCRPDAPRHGAAAWCWGSLLAVAMTWPMAAKFDRSARLNFGDGEWSVWNVTWVAHALTTNPAVALPGQHLPPRSRHAGVLGSQRRHRCARRAVPRRQRWQSVRDAQRRRPHGTGARVRVRVGRLPRRSGRHRAPRQRSPSPSPTAPISSHAPRTSS